MARIEAVPGGRAGPSERLLSGTNRGRPWVIPSPWPLVGVALLALLGLAGCGNAGPPPPSPSAGPQLPAILLPRPRVSGTLSLEGAIAHRRSVRAFAGRPLSLAEVAQLLWAAQGVTDSRTGYRAAPSAGALYPLEVLLVVERTVGLPAGVYRYVPDDHALLIVRASLPVDDLAAAALSQEAVGEAPAVLVLAAVFERTTKKYGRRGERYVLLEAGHAAQNVYLQAEALGLGTVAIGAFDDEAVRRALRLDARERPLYLLPVGEPAAR